MPNIGMEEKQTADMSLENLFDDDEDDAEMMLIDAEPAVVEPEPLYHPLLAAV
jgi:hypothetical protein